MLSCSVFPWVEKATPPMPQIRNAPFLPGLENAGHPGAASGEC